MTSNELRRAFLEFFQGHGHEIVASSPLVPGMLFIWRFALAVEIRTKKFGAELPAAFKEKARQMRFLQYRGFEQEHIQSAMLTHGEA